VDGPISNKAHDKIKKWGLLKNNGGPYHQLSHWVPVPYYITMVVASLDDLTPCFLNNPIPAFTYLPTYGTFFLYDRLPGGNPTSTPNGVHPQHTLFVLTNYIHDLFVSHHKLPI